MIALVSYFATLDLIIFAKPSLPYKVTCSQVPGLRTWTSLQDHYTVCHSVSAPPRETQRMELGLLSAERNPSA